MPHAFDLIGAYHKHRKADGARASDALRWAKEERNNRAFFWRRDEIKRSKMLSYSDLPRETIETYKLESKGEALRVEFALVADNDCEAFDKDDSDDSVSLYTYFRGVPKMGRTQAREAVHNALERRETYKRARERGDYSAYGVMAWVYWRGELVAEDSCWGYVTDSLDVESFERAIVGNALHIACGEIRKREVVVRSWSREFGFAPLARVTH